MNWLTICMVSFIGVLTGATVKPNKTQYANAGSDVLMTFPFQTVGTAVKCLQNETILSNNGKINPAFDEQTRRRIYFQENKLEIKNFTKMDEANYSCINKINDSIVTYGINVKILRVVHNITEKNIGCTIIVVNGNTTANSGTTKIIVAVFVCAFILIVPVALHLYRYIRTVRNPVTPNQGDLGIPETVSVEADEYEIPAAENTFGHQFSPYETLSADGTHEHIYLKISDNPHYIDVDFGPTAENTISVRGLENRTNYAEINFEL